MAETATPKHAGGGLPFSAAGQTTGLSWEAAPSSVPRPEAPLKIPKRKNPVNVKAEWIKGKSQVADAYNRWRLGQVTYGDHGLPIIKMGPPKVEVFDVTSKQERTQLNKLLARGHATLTTDNPAIHISTQKDMVVGNALLVYLVWSDVYYIRIRP